MNGPLCITALFGALFNLGVLLIDHAESGAALSNLVPLVSMIIFAGLTGLHMKKLLKEVRGDL